MIWFPKRQTALPLKKDKSVSFRARFAYFIGYKYKGNNERMNMWKRFFKNIRQLWRALPAIVSLMMLSGCDSSDNHVMDDAPIDIDNHLLTMRTDVDTKTYQWLSAFFQAELHHPYWNGSGQEFPGFFGQLEWDAQPCYLINSMEEFRVAYKGKELLPEVDFDKYSVLVGRTYRIDGSESLGIYNLVDEGDHYRMHLGILRNINPNYGFTADIGDLFYWDVYPKCDSKPITIERRVVEKVIDREQGILALQYQWNLTSYIDKDGINHQVGQGWGDERLNICFGKEGKVKGIANNNSYTATYQAYISNVSLASGDDLAYSGKLSLADGFMTEVNEKDPDALYFGSHIWDIAYFDVNSYYLRLITSKGEIFYFRESTLK